MVRLLSGMLLAWLLVGCGEGSGQRPYLMGQPPKGAYASRVQAPSEKIETAKIEAQTQKEIAQINKERDIELQKIKSRTDETRAGINKAVALEEVQTKKTAIEKEHEYDIYLLLLTGTALLLLFLFLFHYTGKNRKERLKKHEDELMLRLRMQEQELKMKVAEKMLDSITSGKLTPEQENRLIETLEHTTTRLIEQKK